MKENVFASHIYSQRRPCEEEGLFREEMSFARNNFKLFLSNIAKMRARKRFLVERRNRNHTGIKEENFMSKEKFIITCPKCGKVLFKSEDTSNVEVQCPKCGAQLKVEHANSTLSVKESSFHYTA